MNQYHVGDYVKIVDDGKTYSGYVNFFDQIGQPEYKDEFRRSGRYIGWGMNDGDCGHVIGLGTHERDGAYIYVVRVEMGQGGAGYLTLIEERGIIIEEESCEEIEDFELSEFLDLL